MCVFIKFAIIYVFCTFLYMKIYATHICMQILDVINSYQYFIKNINFKGETNVMHYILGANFILSPRENPFGFASTMIPPNSDSNSLCLVHTASFFNHYMIWTLFTLCLKLQFLNF